MINGWPECRPFYLPWGTWLVHTANHEIGDSANPQMVALIASGRFAAASIRHSRE
jgi:hypothetical protein